MKISINLINDLYCSGGDTGICAVLHNFALAIIEVKSKAYEVSTYGNNRVRDEFEALCPTKTTLFKFAELNNKEDILIRAWYSPILINEPPAGNISFITCPIISIDKTDKGQDYRIKVEVPSGYYWNKRTKEYLYVPS